MTVTTTRRRATQHRPDQCADSSDRLAGSRDHADPHLADQSSAGGPPPTGERATPGTVVGGRYELRTPIGNGGMGTVWRATDTLLRRDVAVKEVLLPPTMPQTEQDALCERTLREARAAAALSHPSVVQVYDVVTDGGRPWIVMELLEARSLADMVIDDGPLSPRAVAKIGIAMLGALEVAHAAGVLHRDVKPANVLICNDGRCVLTDFGVARLPTESKLTTPGMVLGSPHFISPERAVGGAFGPPSDLFSLGVTLYTAVEGGPPFDRGDPFETMRAVVEEEPRPARLAGPLQPVLWGLLDKEPSRRWSVEQARARAARAAHRHARAAAGPTPARHDTDPQPSWSVPPAGTVRRRPTPAAPATARSAAGPCSTRTSRSPASSPGCGRSPADRPDAAPAPTSGTTEPARACAGTRRRRRSVGTEPAPSRAPCLAGDVAAGSGRCASARRADPRLSASEAPAADARPGPEGAPAAEPLPAHRRGRAGRAAALAAIGA